MSGKEKRSNKKKKDVSAADWKKTQVVLKTKCKSTVHKRILVYGRIIDAPKNVNVGFQTTPVFTRVNLQTGNCAAIKS